MGISASILTQYIMLVKTLQSLAITHFDIATIDDGDSVTNNLAGASARTRVSRAPNLELWARLAGWFDQQW